MVRTHSGRGSSRNNLDPSSWDWPRFKSTLQTPNRLPPPPPPPPLLVSVTGWLQSQLLFLSTPPENGLFLFVCFAVVIVCFNVLLVLLVLFLLLFCMVFWCSFFSPPPPPPLSLSLLFLLQLTVNILCKGCQCCTRTKQILSLG